MLTIVATFYQNPAAVAWQIATYRSYASSTMAKVQLLFVDDGSPGIHSLDFAALAGPNLALTVLRIDIDIPWHQGPARNLGVLLSTTDWVAVTDIDHVIEEDSLRRLLEMVATRPSETLLVRFQRLLSDTREPRQPHPNSFLVNRSTYIGLRGADPDFAGHYGHDDHDFLRRWRDSGGTVIDHPNLTIIAGSGLNTQELDRDQTINLALREQKRLGLAPLNPAMVTAPWSLHFTQRPPRPSDAPRSSALHPEVTCSGISLDPRFNPVRVADFPADHRPDDLEVDFDDTTFCFDLFRESDSEHVQMLCPPLPDGLDWQRDVRIQDSQSGAELPFRVKQEPARGLHSIRLRAKRRVAALEITVGRQRCVRAIQPSLTGIFAGKRVLLTLSKDNPLEWIVDWVHYHVTHFGVNAVLFYDNDSTSYDLGDLRLALAAIPGIDIALVLDWPHRIGLYVRAQGVHWTQAAMLEHARRRFLARADLVFQIDVDESILQCGEETLDALLARNPEDGWFALRHRHVRNVRMRGDGLPRHRDYWVTDIEPGPTGKYIVRPLRLGDNRQWDIHRVINAPAQKVQPADFVVAHFLPLTTGWQGRNRRLAEEPPDASLAYQNDILKQRLDEAFPEETPTVARWSPLLASAPFLARRAALDRQGAGDIPGALQFASHAFLEEPGDPRHCALIDSLIRRLGESPSPAASRRSR